MENERIQLEEYPVIGGANNNNEDENVGIWYVHFNICGAYKKTILGEA